MTNFNDIYTITRLSNSVGELSGSRAAPLLFGGLRTLRNNCSPYVNLNTPGIDIDTEKLGTFGDAWRIGGNCAPTGAAGGEEGFANPQAFYTTSSFTNPGLLTVPANISWVQAKDFSISLWFKTDYDMHDAAESAAGHRLLFAGWLFNMAFELFPSGGVEGGMRATVGMSDDGFPFPLPSPIVLWDCVPGTVDPHDKWQHYAMTYEENTTGSDDNWQTAFGLVNFYVDGVKYPGYMSSGEQPDWPFRRYDGTHESILSTSGSFGNAGTHVGLGVGSGTWTDDLTFYNKTLSTNEVGEIYNSASSVDLSTLGSYSNCLFWYSANSDVTPASTVSESMKDETENINGTLLYGTQIVVDTPT